MDMFKLLIALLFGAIASIFMRRKNLFEDQENPQIRRGFISIITSIGIYMLLTFVLSIAGLGQDKFSLADSDIKGKEKQGKGNKTSLKKEISDEKTGKEDEKSNKKDGEKNEKDIKDKKETGDASSNKKNLNSKEKNTAENGKEDDSSSTPKKPASTKIEYKTEQEKVKLAYDTNVSKTYDLLSGESRVIQEGKDGYRLIEHKYKYENGKKTLVSSYDLDYVKPVDKIVEKGIGLKPQIDHNVSKQLFNETNAYRQKHGKSKLAWDDSLYEAAKVRAEEISRHLDANHTRPDGRPFQTVLDDFGIYWYSYGENIAAGQPTVAVVIDSWHNSDGHRSTMQSEYYTHMGVAAFRSQTGVYHWVQIFVTL